MNYKTNELILSAEHLLSIRWIKEAIKNLQPGEEYAINYDLEVYRYMDGECLSLVDTNTGDELAALLYNDETKSFELEVLV